VPEPRDRPIEQSARGSLRPWFFSAEGHLALLFKDPEEAGKPGAGSWSAGCRMRTSALTAHRTARERYLGNARAEGHPALELPVLLVRDEEILHHGHEDVLSAQTRLQA
jgi:hypothetical protein